MPHAVCDSMTTITLNLQAVRTRINSAAAAFGRDAAAVSLLAVSKTAPAACIEEAHAAGQRLLAKVRAGGRAKIMPLMDVFQSKGIFRRDTEQQDASHC